jgi:hypothetical protein
MAYIKDYQSKPSFNCLGRSPYGVFFGVELEVEVKDFDKEDKAHQITDVVNGFAITKHDGSLNYGFEICSSPASLDYHENVWNGFFKEEILEGLKAFGTTTAGMHVHISRAPLSDLQIGKIISFIHNPENAKFIRRIAQRDSNKYNDYSKVKKVSSAHDKYLINEARYTAVNLLNKNTVEIRIFKSNLKRESFLKNIEFCAALTAFTWVANCSIKEAQSWRMFAKFVRKNRKFYPRLYSYLVRNKYIISKRHMEYAENNLRKHNLSLDTLKNRKREESENKKTLNKEKNKKLNKSWAGASGERFRSERQSVRTYVS